MLHIYFFISFDDWLWKNKFKTFSPFLWLYLSLTLDFHCFKIRKIKMSQLTDSNCCKLFQASWKFQRHFFSKLLITLLITLLICFVLTQYLLTAETESGDYRRTCGGTQFVNWASLSKAELSNQLKFVLISSFCFSAVCSAGFDFRVISSRYVSIDSILRF